VPLAEKSRPDPSPRLEIDHQNPISSYALVTLIMDPCRDPNRTKLATDIGESGRPNEEAYGNRAGRVFSGATSFGRRFRREASICVGLFG
jgi:hypothetical protein